MKKIIKSAFLSALVLGSTAVYATNGDNMIGLAVESRAMGSVGIAKSFGAGSGLANAALLSSIKNTEVTGTVTFFMPDVAIKSNAFGAGTMTDSDADFNVIPEIYFADRINDQFVYGLIVAGTAGMGTDYSDTTAPGVNRMKTNLMLLKIAAPISYQINDLSLGFTPILQYGKLLLDHDYGVGNHLSNNNSDIGLGFEVGLAYEVLPSLTLGAIYKSKIAMEYKDVMSKSIASFASNITSGDKLDQPEEYGIGISYNVGGNTLAMDYRFIAWGSATGYKDFGWVDQNVISIGYEYDAGEFALRAGYNHADTPIKEQADDYQGSVKNFFNLAGFPGIVESHYTLGAGYKASETLSYDIAIVYAAEKKESFSTSGFGGTTSADVSHSQLGLTIGATYKF